MRVRIVFIITLCVVGIDVSHAQTSKGSFLIGGSLKVDRHHSTYSNSNQRFPTQAQLTITPTVGYFVIDNLMIGLQSSYHHDWELHDDFRANIFSVGPVVRYYFPIKKISIFPEAAVSYDMTKAKGSGLDADTGMLSYHVDKYHGYAYRAGIGAAWFVAPNIAIKAIFGYKSNQEHIVGITTQTNLYINFGLQFYLPRK